MEERGGAFIGLPCVFTAHQGMAVLGPSCNRRYHGPEGLAPASVVL
jgi:hypothetical protein